MPKRIQLSRGKYALVDDDVADEINRYKWSYKSGKGREYAERKTRKVVIRMPYLVIDVPDGFILDHINGNGLDNRRENLRAITQSDNVKNSRPRRGTSSHYKGVSWHAVTGLWQARIVTDMGQKYLGIFATEEEAAKVYDAKAYELWGDKAWLNFSDHAEEDWEQYEILPRIDRLATYSSQYRGVYFYKKLSKWSAFIHSDGKQRILGTFATEVEAARVRDREAFRLFGADAWLNFPDGAVTP